MPSRDELTVREHRIAALRGASRVQAPSWPDADTTAATAALERVIAQIRSSASVLRDAASRIRDTDAHQAALEMLDAGLDQLADAIRARVDATPLEELLPRLASRAATARGDLLALLDVMIADEPGLDARHERIDLLLLLLATEERNGRRQVVRDPATLTPALQEVAARMAASGGDDLARVEADFVAAARRWQHDAPSAELAAMRARRAELGRRGLAPQAMRGIVFFRAVTSGPRPVAPLAAPAPEAVRPPQGQSASETVSKPPPDSPPATAGGAMKSAPAAPSAATNGAVPGAPPAAPPPVQWKIDTALASASASASAGAAAKPAGRTRLGRRGASRLALAACAVAAVLLWPTNPDAAHVLSKQELRSVSNVLASAYRDGKRSGPLFVATVTAEWDRLSHSAKARSGDQIFAKLAPSGVRELMLYDSRNRLVLHQSTAFPTRIAD